MENKSADFVDVIVIGGGQAGLSCGYYLRKAGLDYVIFDDKEKAGGAWLNTWDSLQIFSPAEHSSLPGYMMPKAEIEYPGKDHVIKYLNDYEQRYDLNIQRPFHVSEIYHNDGVFEVVSSNNVRFHSKVVICATGTWAHPYIPVIKGAKEFKGEWSHSAHYKNPDKFVDKRVMIVGAGNSAAQILADLYGKATTYWVTKEDPVFLPENVDGRFLFNEATSRYKAFQKGEKIETNKLGYIVQVESVKKLYNENKLEYYPMFDQLDGKEVVWENGDRLEVDHIIFCTGFKSAIGYTKTLKIQKNGRIATKGSKSSDINGLYFVGFGDWTGYASATLIGVGRTAKNTVSDIVNYLS